MNTCLIISGGDYSPIPDTITYDYVIACDHGYSNALKLNITPNLIMGDFDSYQGDSTKDFGNIPVMRYDVMKDDSDTMLAIKKAISLGYEKIIIVCALGGRMDHTYANIQSMAYAASNGTHCTIISQNEYLQTFTGPMVELKKREGYSLSLFSLSDSCEGLTIKGAKYNADNITLNNNFPLGLSNEWASENVVLSMESGILLIIESRC